MKTADSVTDPSEIDGVGHGFPENRDREPNLKAGRMRPPCIAESDEFPKIGQTDSDDSGYLFGGAAGSFPEFFCKSKPFVQIKA